MPVEIRELVIKTTISSQKEHESTTMDPKSLNNLKQQVVQECLKALKKTPVKDSFNR